MFHTQGHYWTEKEQNCTALHLVLFKSMFPLVVPSDFSGSEVTPVYMFVHEISLVRNLFLKQHILNEVVPSDMVN